MDLKKAEYMANGDLEAAEIHMSCRPICVVEVMEGFVRLVAVVVRVCRAFLEGLMDGVVGEAATLKLAQHVLADIPGLRPAIAVWSCNVAVWHVAVCDVAFLRPWSCPDVPDVFADVAHDLDVAWIFTSQSAVFANIAVVLPDLASVQPAVAVV